MIRCFDRDEVVFSCWCFAKLVVSDAGKEYIKLLLDGAFLRIFCFVFALKGWFAEAWIKKGLVLLLFCVCRSRVFLPPSFHFCFLISLPS
jgi:hypothetical protein